MDKKDVRQWEIPQKPWDQTNKNHLLGLICELKSVSVLAASYKLETPIDVVSIWAKELESDGLISVDYQGVDPIYTITDEGVKRLLGVEKDLREEQRQKQFESYSTPIDSNLSDKSEGFRRILKSVVLKFTVRYDLFALISVLISLRLFYLFIRDPNAQVYSFFFGSLLLSATVFFYRKYRRMRKEDAQTDFIQWLPNFVIENRIYITTILIAFSLVYVLGLIWLNPTDLPFYLLLAVFLVSIAVLPYSPHRTPLSVVKYLFGTTFVAANLLMMATIFSLTSLFLSSPLTLVDFVLGFFFLVLAYRKQDYLGLSFLLKDKAFSQTQ